MWRSQPEGYPFDVGSLVSRIIKLPAILPPAIASEINTREAGYAGVGCPQSHQPHKLPFAVDSYVTDPGHGFFCRNRLVESERSLGRSLLWLLCRANTCMPRLSIALRLHPKLTQVSYSRNNPRVFLVLS